MLRLGLAMSCHILLQQVQVSCISFFRGALHLAIFVLQYTISELCIYYTVRPGLTGIAQTSGNAALSWEKRWEQDIQYIDQISFSLDTRLLLKTLLVIVLGEEKFEVST